MVSWKSDEHITSKFQYRKFQLWAFPRLHNIFIIAWGDEAVLIV